MEKGVNLDLNAKDNLPLREVEKATDKSIKKPRKAHIEKVTSEELVNCLRNEKVIVRHIPKQSGMVTNPKHILYGGMAENSIRTFVVPKLTSGLYVNVLTVNEKKYLEDIMGLEENALSIYKKENNFWSDANQNGINRVTLYKQDNYLDLSDPGDYIKYKILLANKDFICPSMQELQDRPKATYQFVLISEGEETKTAQKNMSATMMCYKEFGKIEDNKDKLKLIVETISGRKLSAKTSLEYLQTQANDMIQADNKMFLKVITDPLLDTKVTIKQAVDAGLIADRGGYLYIKDGNIPMCDNGEEPTLTTAAKYLNKPKNQEMKFTLEAKINDKEK
jgi:hypothetical protein